MTGKQKRRRGFSLIEAAIVLAVVGGVIGAIWWGASAVYERHKADQMASTIITSVYKTRSLFGLQGYPSTINNGNNITKALIGVGVIQDSGLISSYGDPMGLTPWGGSFGICLGNYAGVNLIHIFLNGDSLIYPHGIDHSQCEKTILMIVNKVGRKDDLYKIYIENSSGSGQDYYPPINLTLISCPDAVRNLQFVFKP